MYVGGVEESDKHIDIKQCDHGSFASSRSFRTSSGVTIRSAAGKISNPFRRFVDGPPNGCESLCALVQKLIFQRFCVGELLTPLRPREHYHRFQGWFSSSDINASDARSKHGEGPCKIFGAADTFCSSPINEGRKRNAMYPAARR
jgi:hypothetical protein